MIPINEIRVNNWFNLEFVGPFQWECSHFDEYVKDKSKGYDVEGCVVSDKVEPIWITPDILEQAGFVNKAVHEYWMSKRANHLWANVAFNMAGHVLLKDTYDHGLVRIVNVLHLHHLQNIYFAICGEELNIDLSQYRLTP